MWKWNWKETDNEVLTSKPASVWMTGLPGGELKSGVQCRASASESSYLRARGGDINTSICLRLTAALQGYQLHGVSSLQKWWVRQLQKPNKCEYWRLDVCPACTEEVKGSWVWYLQSLIQSHKSIISLVDKTVGNNSNENYRKWFILGTHNWITIPHTVYWELCFFSLSLIPQAIFSDLSVNSQNTLFITYQPLF